MPRALLSRMESRRRDKPKAPSSRGVNNRGRRREPITNNPPSPSEERRRLGRAGSYGRSACCRAAVVRKALPGSDHLILDGVEQTDHGIAARVRARHLPVCPACGDNRISFHSRYQRRLRDLPWQGRCVQLLFQKPGASAAATPPAPARSSPNGYRKLPRRGLGRQPVCATSLV